jgi:hypothetical protein
MSSPRRSRRLAGLPPVESDTPMKIVYPDAPVARNVAVERACERFAVGLYICATTMVLLNSVRVAVALIL